MSEDYLLEIGIAPCNIYTHEDGEQGHLEESTGPDGPRATVQFICDWDARNDLKAGLLGTVDYQGGTIVRTPPFSYPVASEDLQPFQDGTQGMFANRLFCTAVPRAEGRKWAADFDGAVTGRAGWGYFTYAVVTAEFTAPPYLVAPLSPQPEGGGFRDLTNRLYMRSKLRVNGEVFSPPSNSYGWTEGLRKGKPIDDANVGLLRAKYELSVTRVRMPIVPSLTLDQAIGTVNTAVLHVGENVVSPQAALFMGYNVEEKSDPYHGGIVFDIEMVWGVNGYIPSRSADGNWNWFVDPTGHWSGIGTLEEGDPPFPNGDHDALFSDQIS